MKAFLVNERGNAFLNNCLFREIHTLLLQPVCMPDTNYAAQYYLFMKWFKTNYFSLYAKYRLHIIVPTGNYKIEVAMDYVDPADNEAMTVVIKQYYSGTD